MTEKKTKVKDYEAPKVEVVEVMVEKGFALSGNATIGGYEYEGLL